VKPEEDTQRQSQLLYDDPRLVAEKLNLNWRLFNFLNLKGINNPDGEITNKKERHDLSSGFRAILVSAGNSSPCNILNEEKLEDDLNNRNDARDHDHQVGGLPVVSQTAGDDAEGGVAKHPEGRHLEKSSR